MRYVDLVYNGSKYRAVRFTEYRPNFTENTDDIANSGIDNNGYYINNTYWFKYEPISWRVVDPNDRFALKK